MDNNKRIELLRQKNKDLSEKLETAKIKIEAQEGVSQKQQEATDSLVAELESIKQEFLDVVDELKGYRDRYSALIDECTKLRDMMKKQYKRTVPWYDRVRNKKE